MSRAVLISLLMLLTLSARAEDAAKRAKVLYESGIRLYNVGEYEQALKSFKEAYLAKPDPVLLFNMGQSQRQIGDHEGAVRSFKSFLRELPDAPNREQVERLLQASQQEVARQHAPPAPAPKPAPVQELTPSPQPLAVSAPADQPRKSTRRPWVWGVVGVVAAVAVAGAAVGIVYGVPHDASVRNGTEPTINLSFR